MNKRRQSISGFPKVKFMERSPGISAIECMPSQFFTQAQTVCSIHFRFSAPLDCTLISGLLSSTPMGARMQKRAAGIPAARKAFLLIFTAALLVFLAAATGAGVVAANILFFYKYLGGTEFLGNLMALFLGEHSVPLL